MRMLRRTNGMTIKYAWAGCPSDRMAQTLASLDMDNVIYERDGSIFEAIPNNFDVICDYKKGKLLYKFDEQILVQPVNDGRKLVMTASEAKERFDIILNEHGL